MNDTPQEFIKSVMDADDTFVQGLDFPTLLSVFVPVADRSEAILPKLNPLLDNAKKMTHEIFTELKDFVDNPPECIEDDNFYILKNYIANSEIYFVLSVINNTFLKDYIHIPDGVKELAQQLKDIPCCNA